MNTFGKNLKSIRTSQGLSQFQLAKLIGTTPQRISEWETDKVEPGLTYIIKIMKALDIGFEELTDGINK